MMYERAHPLAGRGDAVLLMDGYVGGTWRE